jgi:hypothetical protein
MNNFWSTIVVSYLFLDYIFGLAATAAVRYATGFDIRISWINVQYGWTELTLSIGPIFFYNPEKYKNTPFLLKIGRISVRVKPKSFLPWAKKEAPMDVENVEIEGMKLHLERDGKGGLNVWAALGMTDEEGNAMTNDVQKTDDATKAEIDAFEEDGTDDPKTDAAPDKDGKKKEESPAEALGKFRVARVCLRGCRYDIDAFLRASKTKEKDSSNNIIKVQCLEVMELRGKKTNGYPGLFLDQIITTVVMRCVKTVTATNKFTLMKAGIGAAGDQIGQGLKKGAVGAVTGVGKGLLNVNQTRGVKVNARLRGVEAAAEALKVTIHQARHITSDRAKPAAYVKLQIGKKGVKIKSRVATGSANPEFKETLELKPVESLDLDLRVQIFDKHIFNKDQQIGGNLKIPLARLLEGPISSEEFMIPEGDGSSVGHKKDPFIVLSVELIGLKEIAPVDE